MNDHDKKQTEGKNHNHNHEGSHHEHMIQDYKRKFFVSIIATVFILVLSPMIQEWFGFEIQFTGSLYILFVLSTFVYFYGGWPFLKGFYEEVKDKKPGMMTLITMAITVAYIYSSATVFGLEGDDFFWELATLIVIMLLGHWIEMRSVLNASKALDKLAALMPDTAHLLKNGDTEDVEANKLQSGDRILVKPGEKIPADGSIAKGATSINESMLTGESKPVEKERDDKVIGGSINGEGSIEVIVGNIGEDSYLSKVITMVREAQKSKSKTQNLVDRAAFWLTIIALTVGAATFIVWILIRQDLTFAVARMATVMVITCPHALGLATPLVVANSTALSAKNGFLIRNRTAFENSRKIDTVVFDKTGTLTLGEFGVNEIKIFSDEYDEKEVLKLAASLEQNSEHPIAKGILEKAREENIELVEINDFKALKGKGIQGKIEGRNMMVVSPGYLSEQGIFIPSEGSSHGISTNVYLLIKETLIAMISLSDQIREESFETVKQLKEQDISCWMLTGDNEETAAEVSKKLNLDGYFSEVLPDAKQDKIKELQRDGKFVAMTGDGVNDAPALAQADVGIAIGAGTDVAAETADIILVNSNPKDILKLISFGRATYRKIVQNLIWATAYNIFAIPLAAGVLISVGIMISPAIGAILMSLSTIIVAINAKLLIFSI